MDLSQRLKMPLLLLRLSVFLVMLMWTVDKFLTPENAIMIFEHFYHIDGLAPTAVLIMALMEMILLIMFLIGYEKTVSYGLVMLFHGVSTVGSYAQYLSPFDESNMLFFAAWPMLAACVALFMLRDQDQLLTIKAR